MSEHTPGPWRACWFTENTRTRIGSWTLYHDERSRCVPLRRCRADNQTAAANARLIAAAPDMLKALKAIHYYETIRDPNRGELYLGALRQVEDAIAKAEGRS